MSEDKMIVLTTGPLGGLGDHLVYSTLPERFSRLGYKVYLDEANLTRNVETYDLIWAHNPWILGTSDRKPNAGYVKQGMFYDLANRFPLGSIEAMERAHGLEPPYNIAPKIYYQPKPFPLPIKDAVLADFCACSSRIGAQGISDFLLRMNNRFEGRQFYLLRFRDGVVKETPPVEGPTIEVDSIYKYADAIAAAYGWVGSEAGGQALAAAVRGEHDVYDLAVRPQIVVCISPKTYNSRGYTFRTSDYRVTMDTGYTGDYWDPVEVPYEHYSITCRRSVEEARKGFETARAS